MVREADQRAVDGAYAFPDEFLRRTASGALARMPAVSGQRKLSAHAMTPRAEFENHEVSIDEVLHAEGGWTVLQEGLPEKWNGTLTLQAVRHATFGKNGNQRTRASICETTPVPGGSPLQQRSSDCRLHTIHCILANRQNESTER